MNKPGRTCIIGVLLVSLLRLPGALAEQKDVEDFADLDLEEMLDVVFTAAKHEQDIGESPSAITVITREQIENTWCSDVDCLLRQVPEVDVLELKPMFSVAGARALSDDQGNKTLFIVDGREINVEAMGFATLQALSIHMEDIERIEIIRGPGSALYGANAHSMVVSITTRKSDSPVELFIGSGEYDRNSLHLRLNQRLGNWHLHLSGGWDTQSCWRNLEQREREVQRVRLSVNHQSDASSSSLQLSLAASEGWIYYLFGAGNIKDIYVGSLLLDHQREHIKARAWYAFYTGIIPVGTTLEFGGVFLGRLVDEVPFFTSTLDTEVQVDFEPFQGNLLIAGGNFRWIKFLSEEAQPDEVDQYRLGLFIHDEQRLGDSLTLTGSLRFDYNNITPETLSPRLAGVWKFMDQQYLRLAFGQAFRKPAFFETSFHLKNVDAAEGFDELEDFFLDAIGNEKLDNESVTAFEIGYTGRFLDALLTVEADVFYNRYRDTINFHVNIATNALGIPDLYRSEARFLNQGQEVDSLGGSLSATMRLKKTLRLNANYTFRHSWYLSDAPEDASKITGDRGDRVPWEPAHLFNLSALYQHAGGLTIGAGLHGKSSCEWSVIEEGIFGPVYQLYTPANWLLSAFVGIKFAHESYKLELGLRVINALNIDFHDIAHTFVKTGGQLGGDPLLRKVLVYIRGSM